MIDSFPVDKAFLSKARKAVLAAQFQLAADALLKIRPALQTHPSVLQVRWLLHAAAGHWDLCLSIARDLVAERPAKGACWIALGKSLIHTGHFTEAHTILTRIAPQFPGDPVLGELATVAAGRQHEGPRGAGADPC